MYAIAILYANINAIEYFQLNFIIVFHFGRVQHGKNNLRAIESFEPNFAKRLRFTCVGHKKKYIKQPIYKLNVNAVIFPQSNLYSIYLKRTTGIYFNNFCSSEKFFKWTRVIVTACLITPREIQIIRKKSSCSFVEH